MLYKRSHTGFEIETTTCYLLHCPIYENETVAMLDKIRNINTLEQNHTVVTKDLLFGNIPVDTDVFKTSSGRLKKVMTSYDQTRRRHDVWKNTSDLGCFEDVWFTTS